MKCFAVIDTNVLVSAMITNNPLSPPSVVVSAMVKGNVLPLYNQDILDEYRNVLGRKKFNLNPAHVEGLVQTVVRIGERVERMGSGEYFPDVSDAVFYEVALSKDGAYLVTGNTRHFPVKPIVVTPTEMVTILEGMGLL